MKFREYDNLTPKVIIADSAHELELQLQALAWDNELVDLQFGTMGESFTALALIRKKNVVRD